MRCSTPFPLSWFLTFVPAAHSRPSFFRPALGQYALMPSHLASWLHSPSAAHVNSSAEETKMQSDLQHCPSLGL